MDRARAVTILRAISGYQLSEGRWARVDRALRALEEAARSGDSGPRRWPSGTWIWSAPCG